MASIKRLINQSPRALGWIFNPVRLIQSVNGLLALGEDGAVATLEAVSSDPNASIVPTQLLLILKLLFITPTNANVASAFGRPDIELPFDVPEFSLLPLLVTDDLPFLIAGGFRQGGSCPMPSRLLQEWSAYPMRDTLLIPRTSPEVALEALFASNRWQKLASCQRNLAVVDRLRLMLICQAIRAAGRYGPGPDEAERMISMSSADVNLAWRDTKQVIRSHSLMWSAVRQEYLPSPAAS